MLTGYQAEIVAFIGDGEFVCYDCAHKALDAGEFAAAENGLGSLSPVSRYSVDEIDGERTWEAAEDRVREFEDRHPLLAHVVLNDNNRWRLVDRIADKLGDTFNERCGECGEVLS